MKELFLIRGLPGSGKSTFAKKLRGMSPFAMHIEADMYFEQDGEYKFDPLKVHKAHSWCQECVKKWISWGEECIIVSNTFSRRWEMQPYIEAAEKNGYTVTIITMNGNFGSVHNVPNESIERMKNRWEP